MKDLPNEARPVVPVRSFGWETLAVRTLLTTGILVGLASVLVGLASNLKGFFASRTQSLVLLSSLAMVLLALVLFVHAAKFAFAVGAWYVKVCQIGCSAKGAPGAPNS